MTQVVSETTNFDTVAYWDVNSTAGEVTEGRVTLENKAAELDVPHSLVTTGLGG